MLEEFLKKYDYSLPSRLIRKIPLAQRDTSRLLVYNTKNDTITHDYFYNLQNYLPDNSILILNKTKVLPARLPCVGLRGGKCDLFLVLNEWGGQGDIPVFTDRKITNRNLFLKNNKNVVLNVYKKPDGITYLKNSFEPGFKNIFDLLDMYGETPVPGYLMDKQKTLEEKFIRSRYQTIFAEKGKSVAAPTASLHFTKQVLINLSKKNIKPTYVTLDIGRGTFSNIKEMNLKEGRLHKEKYSIDLQTKEILDNKNITKVVVGTTSCRAVESYGKTGNNEAETDIFIRDKFDFKYTDILITNFHQPQTSLMALVDSFLEFKNSKKTLMDLYTIAIENNYSFYSFGDSMLVI